MKLLELHVHENLGTALSYRNSENLVENLVI